MDPRANRLFFSPTPLSLKVASLVAIGLLSACGSTSPVNPDPQQGAATSATQTPSNPMAVVPTESAIPAPDSSEVTTRPSTDSLAENNPQSAGDPDPDPDPGTDSDSGTGTGTGTGTGSQTEAPASTTLSPSTSVNCTGSADHLMQRTLELINEARSTARSCGSVSYAAADPLTWDTKLEIAARDHSTDMAQHNFFSHTGSDGSSIGTRVTAVDYNWSNVGENIAAGQTTATQTVHGWVGSPGHCSNLMNPAFTQVAVSCVEDNRTDYNYYWTNVLAAPR